MKKTPALRIVPLDTHVQCSLRVLCFKALCLSIGMEDILASSFGGIRESGSLLDSHHNTLRSCNRNFSEMLVVTSNPFRPRGWWTAQRSLLLLSIGLAFHSLRALRSPTASPHNVIHATVDIGQMVEWISQQLQLQAGENGCLAVLHNRNDMACALNSSDGVINSEGKVISRGVTSCAGMTAQHVLLAQTKIGFLTGGRGYNFQELSPDEKQSQREEAFARATGTQSQEA